MYGDEGVYSCVYSSKKVLFWNTGVSFPIGYNASIYAGKCACSPELYTYVCNLFEVILWLYNCSDQCVWLHAVQLIMVVDTYVATCIFQSGLLGHTSEPAFPIHTCMCWRLHILLESRRTPPLPCLRGYAGKAYWVRFVQLLQTLQNMTSTSAVLGTALLHIMSMPVWSCSFFFSFLLQVLRPPSSFSLQLAKIPQLLTHQS